MLRNDMNLKQEIEYVNDCFDKYEKEGFSKIFLSPYDLNRVGNNQGKSFKVLGRMRLAAEVDNGEYTSDLESLPSWMIQFDDGETMVAYPEEIIPSEIKLNLIR